MVKVTFRSEYKVKEGKKMVSKVSQWDEEIKTEADAKLRALALNWTITRILYLSETCGWVSIPDRE